MRFYFEAIRSALYARTEESLPDYVIRHASAYNTTEGYFTVPFRASGNGDSVEYTLYLRPVLSPTYDDGLLPEDSLNIPAVTPAAPAEEGFFTPFG